MTPPPREPGSGRPLVVYGAGGHGQVVAEAAALAGWNVLGFRDDREDPERLSDPPILDPADPRLAEAWFHVAIGNNAVRSRIVDQLQREGRRIAAVVHPSAVVSPTASVADGAYIGAHAVVNARASVGMGAIVNTGAIVEHHCGVAVFAHVAPGAVLGGGAAAAEFALVGLGARVLPGIFVGPLSVVGGGAVVTEKVPPDTTVVGVPARPIQR